MGTIRFSKRVLFTATSAVALSAFAGSIAYAQEADSETSAETTTDDEAVMDTVVVTGIKGSIGKSVNDKRFADQIVDTINAEDIGKSTDQNIAEAMNRISGVSISNNGGEGAQVSIRGSSPNQNVITLNGAALGSTGFNQAVDLSQYSADILSKIEIIKTPSADDEEGSLGGLVNLTTRKPLDIEDNIRTITAQGRLNDLSGDLDYKVSGTLSHKFFNDRVGILLSLVDETNSLRQDEFRGNNWDGYRAFGAQDQNGNEYVATSYSDPSIWGIAPRSVGYGVTQGSRDRQALDMALQWEITDRTDITLNGSFAAQAIDNRFDQVTVRSNDQSRDPNFDIAGVVHPNNLPLAQQNQVPLFTDPTDWHIVNTDTRTWERVLRRFETGDINSAVNRFDNENTTASLEFNHEFTDRLRVSLGGSYQKSEDIPDQQVFVNLQSARENPQYLRFFVSPDDLEPAGYDCRNGACQPVLGQIPLDLGTIIDQPDAAQIAQLQADGIFGTIGQNILSRADDNISFGGNNPDDLLAKSVGVVSQTVRGVEDTQETAFIDVDYDVERWGIESFELGGKYTKREKFVDNQSGIVTNLNAAATVINPQTGTPVLVSNALDQTPLQPFRRRVQASGLLSGIGLGDNFIADGFTAVDAEALFNTIAGDTNFAIDIDNSETRSAEFENLALYFKTNFSFFDDRLTGDIGVRYIETTVDTAGFAGLTTFNESFGRNQRILDLRILRGLMDTSLPACPDAWNYPGGEVAQGDIYRYSRIDGTGVDTQGTLSLLDDVRIPDQGPCHEPILVTGNGVAGIQAGDRTILRRHNNTFFTNNDFFTFDDDPSNGDGFVSLAGTNNTIKSFATSGSHEYDLFLPNLNLNYAVNDEMIARFAVSKTMTRPQIDSLRPGFSAREVGWGDPANRVNPISLFNTQLDPLESTNIDFSFEWYFEPDAMVSIGLFYKDIVNLEETEDQRVYLSDLRTALQNGEDIDTSGLILSADQITLDNCYAEILGEWQFEYNPAYIQEMLYGTDPSFLCAQWQASQVRNAAGAEVKGVELQYTQNYTQLPGIWGGLGLSANYTYQDSSFAKEESSLAPGEELRRLPIPRTPEHSYNITAYWQQDGHQLRLAYGGASDVLVQRNFGLGALWEEGRETLDFSAAYQLKDNISLTFDAANILDQSVRTYFTSQSVMLPASATGGGTALVPFDEGSPLEDGAYKGRTVWEYNTGSIFRVGVRANF